MRRFSLVLIGFFAIPAVLAAEPITYGVHQKTALSISFLPSKDVTFDRCTGLTVNAKRCKITAAPGAVVVYKIDVSSDLDSTRPVCDLILPRADGKLSEDSKAIEQKDGSFDVRNDDHSRYTVTNDSITLRCARGGSLSCPCGGTERKTRDTSITAVPARIKAFISAPFDKIKDAAGKLIHKKQK